ncbi:UNVERIFIED_CONTAM: hypothetical protein K2H54_066852 [Gekko kuhli]
MFRAGYLTLYGNESKDYDDVSSRAKDLAHSLEVYHEFYKLDRLLMKAARSMLSAAEKKAFSSIKKNLWKLLSVKSLNCRANRSVWLESYQQHLVDLGVDEDMQTRAMLLQLWSTQVLCKPSFQDYSREFLSLLLYPEISNCEQMALQQCGMHKVKMRGVHTFSPSLVS